MASIEKGTVFGGRYIVQSQVGTGGMATVYRGIDNVLDRQVAIKVMLPQYASDPAFAQRFKQEAQAAAALQNPYIVQAYDWGRDADTGTYYIVMEFLRGTDLKTGIRSHGALAPRKVAQIGAQVCSALSVAHAHDIIHRDIKPQNIMIQPNGDAKVMDFGIARAKNSHLTQTNSVLGTAHYVSPEQAQGKELDATSDLYSLGVVMYEAATGKLPFEGDDAVSVALKQVNEQPVPPSQINPNVDENLEAIIMRCMDKDPRRRFRSADELRHVLNNYINGRPIGLPAYNDATTRLGPAGRTTQAMSPGSERTTVQQRTAIQNRASGTAPTQRINRAGSQVSTSPRGGSSSMRQQSGNGNRTGLVVGIAVGALIAVILIVVLSLTMCGGNGGSNPSTPDNSSNTNNPTATTAPAGQVKVPSLANYTQQQAKNRLAEDKLEIGEVKEEASSTVPVGKIIRQDPAANSQVAEGTKVNIWVSSGSANITVTDIRGRTEAEAMQILQGLGLTGQHDATLDTYSDTYAQGQVVTYQPANQQVAKGSTVRYGLSKGQDPVVTVPDNLMWAYYDAIDGILAPLGLNANVTWTKNNDVAWGYVYDVQPAVGTQLNRGDTVYLTVSDGPDTLVLNNYEGWGIDNARADLESQGFTVTVDQSTAAPSADVAGLVFGTNPAAGTEVNKGSAVTINAYGSYTSPSGNIPSDIDTYGIQGAVDTLQGIGFQNVTVTDGTSVIDPSNYGNYSISSVDGAGSSVPLSDEIVIHVTPRSSNSEGGSEQTASA